MRSNAHHTQDVYIQEYYTALDCPRALTCLILYREGEHDQLAHMNWDPLDYNTFNDARDSLAASKFLSKAKFLKTSYDLEKVALEKFKASEAACFKTNRRLQRLNWISNRSETERLACAALMHASRKIDQILGSFDAEEWLDSCDWGPGASAGIPRRNATSPYKYSHEKSVSKEAHDLCKDWFTSQFPHWEPVFEPGTLPKIVAVPKDAKSHRTISAEPGFNIWFQKGIGKMIRRRLRRIGIDLNDQEINQKKARIASRYNDVATVDFSSASDMISKRLVMELLPDFWYKVMNKLRSIRAVVDGETIELEKFSSMGNGFTFELETLIFYSLATYATWVTGEDESKISVYGDDVILPSKSFDTYRTICEYLGFMVNVQKSYSETYYRESCGAHYWNGVCIKPIFQKDPINDKESLLRAANSVRRLAHRRNHYYGCDARLLDVWQHLADTLGPKAPRISEGYGDIGLIENIDHPDVITTPTKHGYEGVYAKVWAVLASQREFLCQGLHLSKLKRWTGDQGRTSSPDDLDCIGNKIPMPLRVRHAKLRVLVPRWYALGPWC